MHNSYSYTAKKYVIKNNNKQLQQLKYNKKNKIELNDVNNYKDKQTCYVISETRLLFSF